MKFSVESQQRSAVYQCLEPPCREPKNLYFECTIDDECLANRSCIQNQCLDPCNTFSCGTQTRCSVVEHSPMCSCLDGYIGDPNVACTPLPGK